MELDILLCNSVEIALPPNSVPASLVHDKCELLKLVNRPGSRIRRASSSGASAVAIDNKIEQAMDLVKSHLMYAVREEVEVLKEKIAELMERISQLESENNILRAGASPETLAQLPAPQPQQNNNPS
uniref:Uncharacterized protein n=1 Tax=Rhodnius prolixus TaxID=13249 RepID=T1IDA3_RHOPR